MSPREGAGRREFVHAHQTGERTPASLKILSAILLVLALAAPSSTRAQGSYQAAVSMPQDSTPAGDHPALSRRSRIMPYVFFGAMAAGLVANSVVHLDRDPGGYHDTWNTEASFPDKVVHGLAAFALASVGVDLSVRPLVSAATTCAAGAIFESTQGYVSRYDIGADCAGAALAGLWRHWRASR